MACPRQRAAGDGSSEALALASPARIRRMRSYAFIEALLKTLTIRNVPPQLSEALNRVKSQRGTSLNQTVIDVLSQALGVTAVRSNGLARLAGAWTEEELGEFEQSVTQFEQIDPELWD